jgi:hypothetical protein
MRDGRRDFLNETILSQRESLYWLPQICHSKNKSEIFSQILLLCCKYDKILKKLLLLKGVAL